MKSYSSREIIGRLTAEGWYEVGQRGSHMQFKHRTKPGRVTVPHPGKDISLATLKSIFRQAGMKPPR